MVTSAEAPRCLKKLQIVPISVLSNSNATNVLDDAHIGVAFSVRFEVGNESSVVEVIGHGTILP